MNHLIRRSLYAANVVLVAGLAGCASDIDTGASDDAEVSSTSTPLVTKPLITLDGQGCLISPVGKTLMQKKVTTAFNYVIGGNNKFIYRQYPCT